MASPQFGLQFCSNPGDNHAKTYNLRKADSTKVEPHWLAKLKHLLRVIFHLFLPFNMPVSAPTYKLKSVCFIIIWNLCRKHLTATLSMHILSKTKLPSKHFQCFSDIFHPGLCWKSLVSELATFFNKDTLSIFPNLNM